MEKFKVTKLAVGRECINDDLSTEWVGAGTRVLVAHTIDTGWYIVSWKELTKQEVKEQYEQNECFRPIDTVYTEKGNRVDIYDDVETTEVFFCVNRLQGAN